MESSLKLSHMKRNHITEIGAVICREHIAQEHYYHGSGRKLKGIERAKEEIELLLGDQGVCRLGKG